MSKTDNKTWIVFANNSRCYYYNAIKKLKYINWRMDTKLLLSDNERSKI